MPAIQLARRLRRLLRRMATSSGLGGESGMAAVEFALVAPLLLVLVFGMVAYGIYFAVWIAVTEAAAVGARASVAGLTDAERISVATQEVNTFLASYGPMLDATRATVSAQSVGGGGSFQVSVTYDMGGFNLAMIGGLLPVPNTTPTATVTVSNGGL